MRIQNSDNPRINDFLAGMIPHHEGTIGMAEVEPKYDKNPKARR